MLFNRAPPSLSCLLAGLPIEHRVGQRAQVPIGTLLASIEAGRLGGGRRGGQGAAAGARGGGGQGRGRKRKRGPKRSLDELFEMAGELTSESWAEGSKKVIKVARRNLAEWCEEHADERPVAFMEPLFHGDMRAGLHNETTLILWACSLWDANLAPSTVSTYVSMAKSSLTVDLGFVLTPKEMQVRLPRLFKAMRKLRRRIRKKRLGWRARYMRVLRSVWGVFAGLAGATQEGLLNGARQGLLRGADFLPAKAAEFDTERHACVRDVERMQQPRKHLRWKVQPAKKAEQGYGKSEFVLLPEGDGVTDAYTSICRMLDLRERLNKGPLDPRAPLFVGEGGKAVTKGELGSLFKQAALAIGIDPSDMDTHSGRIGGATDLFSTDCPGVLLQMSGRW